MLPDVAVGWPQHVNEIARACRQALSHTEVVFEDLARRGASMRRSIEKMFDDIRGESFETSV